MTILLIYILVCYVVAFCIFVPNFKKMHPKERQVFKVIIGLAPILLPMYIGLQVLYKGLITYYDWKKK